MRNINLKVTKANIKNGEPVNPGKCPIANSIMEQVKNVYYVRVLPEEAAIKVKRGNKITAYKSTLPKEANTFIRMFDDGTCVKPFSLNLNFKKINSKMADLI
jgi:hypothetical protein